MPISLRIDRFLFEEYKVSSSSLAIYRVLYATCILTVLLPQYLWIANFPNSFFTPPWGFTMFFTGFPPPRFFVALNGLCVLAACWLLVGYRTRIASIAVAVLLLTGNAWDYSFGKINHDILLILIPLVLQFAGWGDSYSLDARSKLAVHPSYRAWPLALLALSIGFAMMTAAQAKLAGGWLNIQTHAVRGHILYNYFVTGRVNWIATQLLSVNSGVFWELVDYATVILEGSFLIMCASRRGFRVALALACFFHLGILLTMEISFWPNVLAYGAFCNWASIESRGWVKKILDSLIASVSQQPALKLLASSAVISLVYVTFGNPVQRLAELFGRKPDLVLGFPILVAAAVAAAMFLIAELRKGWGRPRILPEQHPVILFDGVCGLCNKWVDFVMKHDPESLYRFTPLQSGSGQQILERFKMPKDYVDSLVLLDGERLYFRSSGILRVLKSLGPPISLAYAFILIPHGIRDRAYTFFAKHRFRWFGERTDCRIPTPQERSRFL